MEQPTEKLTALIDGDIITYSCGFAAQRTLYSVQYEAEDGTPIEIDCEDGYEARKCADEVDGEIAKTIVAEPLQNALNNVNTLMERIREATHATDRRVFLTGIDNFRERIFPEYKANRPPIKPVHYFPIRQFLIRRYGAEVIDGQEADDAMGINQSYNTIICTRDKDLDMVPGLHYNWHKDEVYYVTDLEGTRAFYKQLIKGDTTDNIPGLFKLRKKRASKKMLEEIDKMDQDKDMWEFVKSLYGPDTPEEILVRNGRLLHMRREEGEMWEPPTGEDK